MSVGDGCSSVSVLEGRKGMDVFQVLTVVNCVSSLLTLVLVGIAVLPHVKQGAVIVRDAILWVTFVFVLSFIGWVGWHRVFGERTNAGWRNLLPTATRPTSLDSVSPPEANDTLYGGPRAER